MDTTLLAAVVTASASIIAVAVTYLAKLLTDMANKRRMRMVHLMSIRNELVVNLRLSEAIKANTRTNGFRFSDSAWASADTSTIYRPHLPIEDIL